MAEPRERFFDDAEYAARLAKVRAAMAAEGIDLFVTTSPGNVCYLVGHFTQAVRDLMFLAVPLEGTPLLQLPFFELPRFEASGIGADVTNSWLLGEDPAESVVKELGRRGMSTGSIAVDTGDIYTPYDITAGLLEGLDAKPIRNLVERVRIAKSPAELAYLREAAVTTDAATQAALDAFGEGVVDYDIAAAALEAMVRAGSEFIVSDPYICVGWRTGAPHSNRGGWVTRARDPLFIELGGTRARYTAPIMRCAVAGEPSREIRELADTSNKVADALIGAMKAGVTVSDIAAVGHAAVEPVLDWIIFHHTYGYPVGLSFPPGWLDCPYFLLNARNNATLEAGMVFHLPLMLRVKGEYGTGCSETVIITEDGAEVLSKLPRELVVK